MNFLEGFKEIAQKEIRVAPRLEEALLSKKLHGMLLALMVSFTPLKPAEAFDHLSLQEEQQLDAQLHKEAPDIWQSLQRLHTAAASEGTLTILKNQLHAFTVKPFYLAEYTADRKVDREKIKQYSLFFYEQFLQLEKELDGTLEGKHYTGFTSFGTDIPACYEALDQLKQDALATYNQSRAGDLFRSIAYEDHSITTIHDARSKYMQYGVSKYAAAMLMASDVQADLVASYSAAGFAVEDFMQFLLLGWPVEHVESFLGSLSPEDRARMVERGGSQELEAYAAGVPLPFILALHTTLKEVAIDRQKVREAYPHKKLSNNYYLWAYALLSGKDSPEHSLFPFDYKSYKTANMFMGAPSRFTNVSAEDMEAALQKARDLAQKGLTINDLILATPLPQETIAQHPQDAIVRDLSPSTIAAYAQTGLVGRAEMIELYNKHITPSETAAAIEFLYAHGETNFLQAKDSLCVPEPFYVEHFAMYLRDPAQKLRLAKMFAQKGMTVAVAQERMELPAALDESPYAKFAMDGDRITPKKLHALGMERFLRYLPELLVSGEDTADLMDAVHQGMAPQLIIKALQMRNQNQSEAKPMDPRLQQLGYLLLTLQLGVDPIAYVQFERHVMPDVDGTSFGSIFGGMESWRYINYKEGILPRLAYLHTLGFPADYVRDNLWIQDSYANEHLDISKIVMDHMQHPELGGLSEKARQYLHENNIVFVDRYPIYALRKALDPSLETLQGEEYHAAIFGGQTDWNGAFDARAGGKDYANLAAHYPVDIFETTTDKQSVEVAQKYVEDLKKRGIKLRFLIFAGHSNELEMSRSTATWDTLDIHDEAFFHIFKEVMAKDAVVYLQGCSTAKAAFNITTVAAKSTGATAIGLREAIGTENILLTDNGLLKDIRYPAFQNRTVGLKEMAVIVQPDGAGSYALER